MENLLLLIAILFIAAGAAGFIWQRQIARWIVDRSRRDLREERDFFGNPIDLEDGPGEWIYEIDVPDRRHRRPHSHHHCVECGCNPCGCEATHSGCY